MSLHIEPKEDNILFLSNIFRKYNEYDFRSISARKKEDQKSLNVSLIKSRECGHTANVSLATEVKVRETAKSSY